MGTPIVGLKIHVDVDVDCFKDTSKPFGNLARGTRVSINGKRSINGMKRRTNKRNINKR